MILTILDTIVVSASVSLAHDPPALLFGLVLGSMLAAVTITDLDRQVIPNRVLLVGALAGLTMAAATDPAGLPERAIAAVGAGAFLLAAALVHPGGMGMGDVKLGAVMGIFLGRGVAAALLVAFGVGAVVGVAILLRGGAAARKRAIPFAPFLAIGGAVGLWVGDAMVAAYLDAFAPA